jgi:hypothetical protein
MQFGLGHRVVWYMVMDVSWENSSYVFTDGQKMEAVCRDRNLSARQSDYMVP